ncbi:DUF4350 domain-containing protein [Okibacterium endophyticum]
MFWVGAAVVCGLVVVASAVLTNPGTGSGAPLDGDSAAPEGARAVLQVLRAEGVAVTVADDIDEARAALEDDATLAFYDPNGYLDAERRRDLVDAAERTVAISPSFTQLNDLLPGVRAAGYSEETSLGASCDEAIAERASTISGGATFAIDDSSDATGCFESETGGFALVVDDHIAVVGPTAPFTNDAIVDYGNAALALGLLGAEENLVWYLPTIADVEATGPPTLQQLTPNWLVPVTSLLTITALVAMFWRGRRFGPIVIEDLPVTVRAGETMQGRARLYQRTASRVRAADALRVGATARLATMLGLSDQAGVYEVADAAASALGQGTPGVRGVLVDRPVQTERDLIEVSDALQNLEHAVSDAVDPRSPHRR